MENKKSNIFMALLLSLLTSLAGAALFGVIYGVGYYIYILAIAEIVCACGVFLKFKQGKWPTILFAVVWSVVWTIIFNFLAIVVCEAIFIANEFSLSFSESYNLLMELWETDSSIKSYMNSRLLQIITMILIGGAVYGVYFAVNKSRANKLASLHNSKQIQTPAPQSIQPEKRATSNTFFNLFSSCKNIYSIFTKDKNKEAFKESLSKLETTYIKPLNEQEKAEIKKQLQEITSSEQSSTEDKNVAKILLTIVK